MDCRWWIIFNTLTLVVLLSNRRPDGTLKYMWAEAMVPTFTHDCFAIFGAFTVNHSARTPRRENELDVPREVHKRALYQRCATPYFVAVTVLKLLFDVLVTLWAMEWLSVTAVQAVIPGLIGLGLVFLKHTAMQLSSPDTLP